MNKRRSLAPAVLILVLLTCCTAMSVRAAVTLRFSPDHLDLPIGGGGSLSVILDDALDVRTIEVWAEYSPAVIASMDGVPGQLFAGSGCPLFPDFVDTVPGQWYGGVVALGATCYVTGPGELYRWDFEGTAAGNCLVLATQVKLYDPLAHLIADVTLTPATVVVGDLSSVSPDRQDASGLYLQPNPFNPRTQLSFYSSLNGYAELSVFDLAGRLLERIWSGQLVRGAIAVSWEGRDALGRSLPSGTYVFRLRGPGENVAVAKGILLK